MSPFWASASGGWMLTGVSGTGMLGDWSELGLSVGVVPVPELVPFTPDEAFCSVEFGEPAGSSSVKLL